MTHTALLRTVLTLALVVGVRAQVQTTTALSVAQGTVAPLGSAVTLNATVRCPGCSSTAAFSGSVAFYDGAKFLGDASFANQPAAGTTVRITTTLLSAGAHSLRATYNGTANRLGTSMSTAVAFTIQASGASSLTAPPKPLVHTTPYDIATGDFNNDGYPDFAVANSASGDVSVLIGNGDGTFRTAVNYATGQQPITIVTADFNFDGRMDLAVGNAGSSTISILLGNGDGTFRQGTALNPDFSSIRSMATGDFNRDGTPDLAVLFSIRGLILIYLGNGNGTFTDGPSSPSADLNAVQVATGDLNGDGVADLALPNNTTNSVSVFIGNGDGTFAARANYPIATTPVARPNPQAIAIGDFNGDGRPDLAVAGQGLYSILLGSGQGAFQTARNYTNQTGGIAIETGDFNGDGRLDLALVQASGSNVDLLVGDGSGAFQPANQYSTTGVVNAPMSLAVVDLNLDGVNDIAAVNSGNNSVTILLGANAPARLTAADGTPQIAPTGSPYLINLQARVLDTGGNGVAGVTVTFTAPTTGASGTFPNGATATAVSDSSGVATAPRLVANNTVGTFTVNATAPGITAPAQFSLSNTSALPATIAATAGTPQSAPINTLFATPLQVTVLDSNRGPVAGAQVTFTAPSVGPSGTFGSNISASVTTNASGVAAAPSFRANGTLGTYTVIATVVGVGTPAQFSLTNQTGTAATYNVSPSTLSFIAYPGFTPSPQVISVLTNGAVVPYTVSVNGGSWLKTSTQGGNTPAAVRVTVDASGLDSGTYTGSVVISSTAGASRTVTVTLTVPDASNITVDPPGNLTFSVLPGTAPFRRTLQVISSSGSPVPVVATVSGATRFASIRPTFSSTPVVTTLTIDPGTLSPGTYSASVTFRSVQNSVTRNITLVIQQPNPGLNVYPPILPIQVQQGATSRGNLEVQNSGGATNQTFTAAVVDAATTPWLSVTPASGTLSGTQFIHVQVTADASRLIPGVYSARVRITAGSVSKEVPVSVTVLPADGVMKLDFKGAAFWVRQGEGLTKPENISVVNLGSRPFTWTAEVLSGSDWLGVTTQSPTSAPGSPGKITLQVKPAFGNSSNTRTGSYYGAVRVSSPQASNSPQLITAVLYVDDKATTPPVPRPDPAGLVFSAPQGGTPPSQSVLIYTSTQSSMPFQIGAQTYSGPDIDAGSPVDWLSVSPTTGVTSTNSTGKVDVSVNTAGLAPGVYKGGVSISMSTTEIRTVSVSLVVTPNAAAAAASKVGRAEAEGCAPTQLVPTFTLGLINDFLSRVAGPTPVIVQVTDDCGTLVPDPSVPDSPKADVTITFSAGDPNAKTMLLTDPTNANYSITWTPDVAAESTEVTVVAKSGDLTGQAGTNGNKTRAANAPVLSGSSRINGQVLNTSGPVLAENGVLNNLNPRIGGLLSPGTLVQIFGVNLSTSDTPVTVPSLPLPRTMNGVQVTIGGLQAPLYYVSKRQINAQIPVELPPGRTYEVQVSVNGALTAPDDIYLVAATPGIATSVDRRIIAQHANYTLVTPSSPAAPGETIIVYLVGMGPTNPPVGSGAASPGAEPLARVVMPPTVTLDDNPVPAGNVAYAGQTGGFVGLYQINLTIPTGTAAGDHNLVVSQGGQSSNVAIVSVR